MFCRETDNIEMGINEISIAYRIGNKWNWNWCAVAIGYSRWGMKCRDRVEREMMHIKGDLRIRLYGIWMQ